MYTSLDWLNELISVKTIQLETLINKLTLGGFEVEEILEIYKCVQFTVNGVEFNFFAPFLFV